MTRKNVIMLCKFIRYQSVVYLFLFVVKKIAKLQIWKYEENLKKKILIIFSVPIILHFNFLY